MNASSRARLIKGLLAGALALVLLAAAVILLLPRPKQKGRAETFSCLWADGAKSEETLSSALACLAGVSQEGVLLEREGNTGTVAASEALRTVVSVLEGGTLAELLSLDGSALTPLESYAVQTFCGDRAYYDGEPFAWDGTCVRRTEKERFSEAVLLGGSFEGDFLLDSGVKTLYLRAEGEVEADGLLYTALSRVVAEAPYFFRGGALWEERYGIERYVSALPPGCTYEEVPACE